MFIASERTVEVVGNLVYLGKTTDNPCKKSPYNMKD